MKFTILSGTEIIECSVGAIMLCVLEATLHKGKLKWANAKAAALAFLGTWCCRKFAVHIYNSMVGRIHSLKT